MSSVTECRKYLKEKISNRKLPSHEENRVSLLTQLKRMLEFGESNSVLVIGQPGEGKTTMVQNVLTEIKNTKLYDNRYHLVELHGLFHNDDNLACQDICKQINFNFPSNENVPLSSDDLSRIFEKYHARDEKNVKSIIFVLNHFDKFCYHKDQHLVYMLFDTARAKKIPIFVIGITSCVTVVECLEKRVGSRFSGIQINICSSNNINTKISEFKELLTLERNACSDSSYVDRWNENIKKLSTDYHVTEILKRLFVNCAKPTLLTRFLYCCISQLDDENCILTLNHLQVALSLLDEQNKIILIENLSTLQICLLIAIHHQVCIYDHEPFNFEMIYQRFKKFVSNYKSMTMLNVHKQVVYKAFETLQRLELITPFSSVAVKSSSKEYAFYRMNISEYDVIEGIKNYPKLKVEILNWSKEVL